MGALHFIPDPEYTAAQVRSGQVRSGQDRSGQSLMCKLL